MQGLSYLESLLIPYKGKKMLCVFPHADDESFVSGGLFQLAQKLAIKTKVIILTQGASNEIKSQVRKREFVKAAHILGIDEYEIYEYLENELKNNAQQIKKRLVEEVSSKDVFSVLTFDPTGITGHEDHIVASVEILEIIKSLKGKKPHLLWRVPDIHEQKFFLKGNKLPMVRPATYTYNLSLAESFNKLKAIFCHKSQLNNFFFKLRIIEWYMFDHRELYYLVDPVKENIYKLHFE